MFQINVTSNEQNSLNTSAFVTAERPEIEKACPESLDPQRAATQKTEANFAPDYDRVEFIENKALGRMSEEDIVWLERALSSITRAPRPSALVAGTGTGREVIRLIDAGFNVTGIDLALPYLDITADKISLRPDISPQNVRLVYSPIEEFLKISKPDSYDCVSCLFSVLNLVTDWQGAINQFSRVLKPGGVLVFSVYGSGSARIFQALESKAIDYDPSILIRRVPGGLSLGESGEFLSACFPEPCEVSEAVERSGLKVREICGFLDLLSLYPKDPQDIPKFQSLLTQADPVVAAQAEGRSPEEILDILSEADRSRAYDPRSINNFAYVGFVASKEGK